MSWRRRQYRAGERPERAYVRRIGFETAKEGGGNLVQQAGAALGALAGLFGSKAGLPPSASVITGAIVGGALGSVGKGFIAASLDHIRERREQRAATTSSTGAGAARSWRHASGGSAGSPGTVASVARSRAPVSIVGQVIGGLDAVVKQLNAASKQLVEIHNAMWDAQNALNAVLAGGRPEIVLTLDARLEDARGHVLDSVGELTGCADGLAAYRAAI
ncbi:hypothetical protein [Micromonospora fluostatini]|uniref:hypothetical protein n=1 Tax=Micromonospora sp. JCM 30529 TaxID=3421643 RepID=UPI003D18692E